MGRREDSLRIHNTPRATNAYPVNIMSGYGNAIGTRLIGISLIVCFLSACSNFTGLRIPGTEKSAIPATTVYLVLENVETIPETLRTAGEIYVDNAYFGNTSRPGYYRYVGNALVVGKVQIEKEKIHTIRVAYPGYEPFEHTRYFGTLPEYSISFRLIRLPTKPSVFWDKGNESGSTNEGT